ncbi:hypothetical protein E4U42_002619 [Claviceps africana]|uniref:Uncharacterized protein n=1 Tax=Claviceps africana TaxID=83212 RepID=A0A8K0JD74_9HYPO|nr:hypothetical protein E4U42_002619 [Claviceps africana]
MRCTKSAMLAAIAFYAGQTAAIERPSTYKHKTKLDCKKDPENARLDCGPGVKAWPTSFGYDISAAGLRTLFAFTCGMATTPIILEPMESRHFGYKCDIIPEIEVWTIDPTN